MFHDFEWLSLDELHEQIEKSLEKLNKGQVDIKPHQKQMAGHTVQVGGYQQHRADATTPIVGIPGPIKHFAKISNQPKSGGTPQQHEQVKHEGWSVVPKNAAKHADCPWCQHEGLKKPLEHGQVVPESYAPPEHPIGKKLSHQITLDDIARGVHKYPFVYNDRVLTRPKSLSEETWKKMSPKERSEAVAKITGEPPKRTYKQLAPQELAEHLRHNPFSHMGEQGEVALLREIENLTRHSFNQAVEWKQAKRAGLGDPESAHKAYARRIAEEMSPYLRTTIDHGYAKFGSPEYDKVKDKHGKDVRLEYHQGMNPDKVNEAADLRREIRARRSKWAVRYLETEAGLNQVLNHPAVKRQARLQGTMVKTQHELDKLDKEAGVGENKIMPDKPYSLEELDNIVKKQKGIYNLVKDYETVKDPQTGQDTKVLKRIHLYEEDPEALTDAGAFTDEKKDEPLFTVDFDKGGKMQDVVTKLAGVLNPKAGGTETTLGKFKTNEEKFHQTKASLLELYKKQDELQKKLDYVKVGPEKHEENIKKTAFQAVSAAQTALEALSKNGIQTGVADDLSFAANTITEYLEDGDPMGAMHELTGLDGLAKKLKGTLPDQYINDIISVVKNFGAEVKAYKEKKGLTPEKREQMQDQIEDQLHEVGEHVDTQEAHASTLQEQNLAFADDKNIQKYLSLKQKLGKVQSDLDVAHNEAEQHWMEQLEGPMAGDEDAAVNHSDKASFNKWQQSNADEKDGQKEYWADKVPEKVDLDNEDELTDAGFKMAMASTKDPDPSGSFMFGGLGHNAGLVHVADKLLNNFHEDGRAKKVVDDFLAKHPTKEHAPEIFKPYANLIDSNRRWFVLHKMYQKAPSEVTEWALRLSDYHPFPGGTEDIRDEKDKDFEGLRKLIIEGNRTKGEDKKLPTTGNTIERYYMLFRHLGNHIIEQLIKDNPNQKAIFDTIKEMNKPLKGKANAYPGNLRRGLKRRMDAHFARYAEDFPPTQAFPDWKHGRTKEELQDWLDWANQDVKQKSLVVFADKMEKGRDWLYVIYEDE
jgi:hypothetical protein